MLQSLTTSSVPLPALGSWRQAANVCGFTIEPVFRDAGIVASETQAPMRVPPLNLFKAFSMCVERAKGHHFPFALGDSFVFEHFAEFDAFIASCSTLREMLELASWARELLAPWMIIHLDEFGSEAHLRVEMAVPDPDPRALCHVREVALSAINQLIRRATKGSRWLLSVRVASTPPSHQQQFTQHFGVPVFFGEAADALVMDRRWLDMPLNAFVPEAHNQARMMIERRMSREVGERRLVEEVRWALERRPELLRDGLEATAAALALHPRTLQRRLQAEGIKYVDIQSQAKCQRAQTMLKRRAISMESISMELGFSDRRAFTFAFKRWTGLSPSAYRDQLGQNSR
ncbi:AraC family transcriptional regulator [Aquabacterium sp. NJ1]|uniref:AraC family transcriptional regulator n=1 Tax=Aquabacterium sp. NJ1 TaxID=1538295 RepID=UPI000A903B77|nr:AraC family transcriptional regulator [Aquabacterium sp. NJ1]